MTPLGYQLLQRRRHQVLDDPSQWAQQTATLHAVQAVTTEVATHTTSNGAFRGVRWLRDVLRSTDASSDPLQTPSRSPASVHRRGLVFDCAGQWQCPKAPNGTDIPRSVTLTAMATCGDFLAGSLPRCASLQLQNRPGRIRPAPRCPSQSDLDSDDEDDSFGSTL
eukprot:GGOE01011540.1.p2 GENE.GGOE01011540.1~~GGOE01011540.1.p2  ORF type:complete len:177 (+),score=30.63 GGOE01011540.1:39-533(+)